MNALLSVDIKQKGDNSKFIRLEPGIFYINPLNVIENQKKIKRKINLSKINKKITSKQKGDIAEAKVAELITLYGDEGLSCYRPISDDEGIDLVVKRSWGNYQATY